MKPSEKSRFGEYFFISIALIYLIIGIYKFQIIKNAFNYFNKIILSILPLLVFIYILMVISDFYLTEKTIKKLTQKKKGIKIWLFAIFGGIISAGPIYMWYPFLSNLKNKGIPTSYLVAFLYNRAIKLPLIPIMITIFPINYLIILFIIMIISSIIQGLIVEKILIKLEK